MLEMRVISFPITLCSCLYAFRSLKPQRQPMNIVELRKLCHSVNFFVLRKFEHLLFAITKSGHVRARYITTATWENIAGKMPRICH